MDFDLFDLKRTLAAEFFSGITYPWELLPMLEEIILSIGPTLPAHYRQWDEYVWIAEDVFVEKTALIQGPAIIGPGTQLRHGAFVRDNVIVGGNTVIGNSTELKNALLFDGVQVPHFNYVGDSILGYKAHLGAGAIVSNFKSTGDEIKVLWEGEKISSGLNKLGALLGDQVEVGCNSVLFPGTVVGRGSVIYPLCPVRGNIPAGHTLKNDGQLYPRSQD